MTPYEIKQALAGLGGKAKKRLGQHFLIDKKALETIVEAADIRRGECVLEVGPGLGVLTNALLDRGADVIAIEQDRRFIEYLAQGVGENLRVIQADAAKIDWQTLVNGRPWKFVSNLPYSITSLALRKALWAPHPPERIVVLIQREVAERVIAVEKTSLLSLMVALASSSAKIVRRVPAGAFYPAPKVESAILRIEPLSQAERRARWGIDPEEIMKLARKGFAHPRKLLLSNLGIKAIHELPLRNLTIDPKARAENLSPHEWAALTQRLMNKH